MYVVQKQFSGANTYGGGPVLKWGTPRGAILLPAGTIITNAQLATLKTTLQALLIEDNIADRAFVWATLSEFKESGVKPQRDKSDNFETKASEGTYIWDFVWAKAGKDTHEQARLFDGHPESYEPILFDEFYNLMGKNIPDDTTGLPQLAGFPLHALEVDRAEVPENNKMPRYPCRIAPLDVKDFTDNVLIVPAGFDPKTLKGVIDVKGTPLVGDFTGMAGTFTTNGGLLNLADSFPALADPGAWVATDNADGTPVTISSVSIVNKQFVFVLSGSTSGHKINISLASISVTKAAPFSALYISQETYVQGTY